MRRFAMLLIALCGCREPAAQETCEVRPGRVPPERPSVESVGERRWFLLRALHLGRRNSAGEKDKTVLWNTFGFNLDGHVSSGREPAGCTCRVAPNGSRAEDGEEGIDNNFGHYLGVWDDQLILGPDLIEDRINASIADGSVSLLFRIDGVGAADNAHAPGALYKLSRLLDHEGHPTIPTFVPEERWTADGASVFSGVDLERPTITFPAGYIRNGVWVSGRDDTQHQLLPMPSHPATSSTWTFGVRSSRCASMTARAWRPAR